MLTFENFLDSIQRTNEYIKNLKNKTREEKYKVFRHFIKYVSEIRKFQLISEEKLKGGKIFNQKFFKFPKVLLFKKPYCYLSSDAKMVYMLLLDQLERSRKNGWFG